MLHTNQDSLNIGDYVIQIVPALNGKDCSYMYEPWKIIDIDLPMIIIENHKGNRFLVSARHYVFKRMTIGFINNLYNKIM